MTLKTLDHHIESTPEVAGGKPHISGRRITVEDIVIWHELLGRSADEIASEYHLSLSDIYAALTYYHDHKTEINESLHESEKFIEALRQKIPSKISLKINDRKD